MFMRCSVAILLSLFFALASTGAGAQRPQPSLYVVDSGGRPSEGLEIGASLEIGVRGLEPNRSYDLELPLAHKRVSYARLTADKRGDIAPFILWFPSGVIGCAVESLKTGQVFPVAYRDFDEAERALKQKKLTVAIRQAREPSHEKTSAPATRPVARIDVPMVSRRSAAVFPSDRNGCLLNSAEAASQDMYVCQRS